MNSGHIYIYIYTQTPALERNVSNLQDWEIEREREKQKKKGRKKDGIGFVHLDMETCYLFR